jgi:hypothetical protein
MKNYIMKILGYSERGVINSLIYNIGENKSLVLDFIKLISFPFQIDEPDDYEIIIEQSFSDFGDCDLIILLYYSNTKKNLIIFFEAKVACHKNWNLEKHYLKKIKTSNLFNQLNLKKKLIEKSIEKRNGIVGVFDNKPKIGKNKIVLGALNRIENCNNASYVGIIPAKEDEVNDFKKKYAFDDVNFISCLTWEKVYEFCSKNELLKVKWVFDYNKEQIFI